MTALLVSPDYVSHYLPLSAVGAALRDEGHEVVFATGDGVRERVLADGFQHAELRLGAGSNATPETHGDDPSLTDFLAATREGMVATLELQARRRLHDLLWEPERVTQRLAEIVDDLRPALVLSDQLAFGASLAFRALDIPFTSFLPGTSVPAATARRTVRLPGPPTGGIRAAGSARGAARALYARGARVHTTLQRDAARAGTARAAGRGRLRRRRPAGHARELPRQPRRRPGRAWSDTGRPVRPRGAGRPGARRPRAREASREGRTSRSAASCPRARTSCSGSLTHSAQPAWKP